MLNGGLSTFLAFILLAGSKSYVFSTFFKVFFLVVTFGLFQGLIVLPVILSVCGPKPNEVDINMGNLYMAADDGKRPNGVTEMKDVTLDAKDGDKASASDTGQV